MNQMFSIILVIMMAFSSIGGMTSAQEGATSFEAKISMDMQSVSQLSGTDMSAMPEESQQTVKLVEDILQAVTLKGTAENGIAELVLLAGPDVLVSIGVKTDETGSRLASSLLGSQVVFASAQLMKLMEQQMMSSMAQGASGMDLQSMMDQFQNLDKDQITKEIEGIREKLEKAFEEKKGETETGEFQVDDMTFTAKTPVNMTYTELMELLLTSAKELLTSEAFQPVVQMFSKDQDLGAQIDKSLEDLKNQPEEEKPVLQLAVYSDADECAYYTCDMTSKVARLTGEETTYEDSALCFHFGKVEGLNRINVGFDQGEQTASIKAEISDDGAMTLAAKIDGNGTNATIDAVSDAAGSVDMVCNITAANMGPNMKIHAASEPAEGGRTAFVIELINGADGKQIMAVTGTAGKGGEIVSTFEGEDITETPFENLMNTEDTTASSQLTMTMMAKLMGAVSTLAKNLPEDSSAMLNQMVKQMMMPNATAPSTEVTQEETVPNE